MTIQANSVTVYTTTDGKEFREQSEAVRHQARVDREAVIGRYVADMEARNKTRVRNLLLDFAAFEAEDALGA